MTIMKNDRTRCRAEEELKALRGLMGGYPFFVSTVMLLMARAAEEVIDRRDPAVLAEMRRLAEETFTQAETALAAICSTPPCNALSRKDRPLQAI